MHPSVARFAVPLADLQAQHPFKRLVVGVAIVSQAHPRKVLIVRRAAAESEFAGLYELPGGGSELDQDATLIDTVVRETEEETGLRVTTILGCFDGFEYETSKGKSVQFNFLVEADRSTVPGGHDELGVKLNPEEHDAHAWVGVEDLEHVARKYALSGQMEVVVKEALKELRKLDANV